MPTALPYNFQGQNENGNWKASSKEWATKWKKGKNHCFLWQVASKSSASVAHQAASEGKSHGDLRDFSRFFHYRTLQSFRIAANWHVDLRLLAIPYFLLFKNPLITRYFRPRILLWANMRLSGAIKWRFWDTISLFLRWIFLWTYVFSFSRLHFQAEHFQISICQV